jgi:hypothetical protein
VQLPRKNLITQGQRKAISEKLKAPEIDPFAQGKTLERYAPLRRVKAGDSVREKQKDADQPNE